MLTATLPTFVGYCDIAVEDPRTISVAGNLIRHLGRLKGHEEAADNALHALPKVRYQVGTYRLADGEVVHTNPLVFVMTSPFFDEKYGNMWKDDHIFVVVDYLGGFQSEIYSWPDRRAGEPFDFAELRRATGQDEGS